MRKYKWHLVFWIPYFLFCYFSDLIIDTGSTLFTEIIFFITNNLYLFYSILFIFRKFSLKNTWSTILSIAYLFTGIGLFFGIRYFVRYVLLSKYVDINFGIGPINEWIVNGIIWIVNYFFYVSAYFYFESSTKKKKDLNELLIDRLNEQKKKLELENTLLKAQINPHFLYNTLNFLYSKALPLSQQLSEGILKLSEIMRYSLQKAEGDKMASINEELEHIQNVVELAKLRFNNKIYVETDFDVFSDDIRIVPIVLITLVENILKHGELIDPQMPARLTLKYDLGDIIKFSASNKKRKSRVESSTGMGLRNAMARLTDAYKNEHKIDIIENDLSYEIILLFPIKRLELYDTLRDS